MNKKVKKSFIFSIYQLLFFLIFDVSSFILTNVNEFFVYFLIVLISFFFNLLSIYFIKNKTGFKGYEFTSFLISALITGVLLGFLYYKTFPVFLIVVSSFVVSSLFPVLFFFLKALFKNKKEIDSSNNSPVFEKHKEEVPTEKETEQVISEEKRFVLTNENGKILLDVDASKIICFEANDNYAVTYYLNSNNEMKKSMERISLRKIEEILKSINAIQFLRVHKSYLINNYYVDELKGKAQAYKVQMKNLQFLVPVSRSFKISTLKRD